MVKQFIKQALIILLMLFSNISSGDSTYPIKVGAEQTYAYLPMLEGKRVGVFANHSSLIGHMHLVDELLKHHIFVVKIFAPEHGFRGDADEKIQDTIDKKTGIPIISLYGKKLKPTSTDLQDIDIIVFDIQDVGVRFYTYISSLQKLMESAIDNNKPIIVLDRPNPNGFYIDGPVLDRKYHSFTGMQPIPIVYGMTIGEYAKMLVGEEWLDVTPKYKIKKIKLTVIPCVNYTHQSLYVPPIKPSPNLPDIQSIYLYPSIGLLEATALSVGRGTDKPFQVFGHPLIPKKFSFIPTSRDWAKFPPFKNKICHGWNLAGSQKAVLTKINQQLQIKYLMQAYNLFPDKNHFFKGFNAASGDASLMQQIQAGATEKEIRKSWEPKLIEFKKIRKKYLIYRDFPS